MNLGSFVVDLVGYLVPLRTLFGPLLHLLPTSLGICVVLGFVLPRSFIPPVYFGRVLPVLSHAHLDCVWEDGEVEQCLLDWRWVWDNSVPLFPDILAGLLVSFTRPQHLAFVPVCSWLLPEV